MNRNLLVLFDPLTQHSEVVFQLLSIELVQCSHLLQLLFQTLHSIDGSEGVRQCVSIAGFQPKASACSEYEPQRGHWLAGSVSLARPDHT